MELPKDPPLKLNVLSFHQKRFFVVYVDNITLDNSNYKFQKMLLNKDRFYFGFKCVFLPNDDYLQKHIYKVHLSFTSKNNVS